MHFVKSKASGGYSRGAELWCEKYNGRRSDDVFAERTNIEKL